MSSEKTKKLLDNLKNITAKTDKFQEVQLSSSNRYWLDSETTTLPSSYDKAKRYKDDDDEEFIYIDRIYGGLFDYQSLEQKNGTTYKGKLYKKRRLMQGADGKNFYSQCTVTADGRWFDNGGIPIIPPKQVEIEKEEEQEKIRTYESWSSDPKEKKEKIELNMLKGLK